MPTLFPRHLQTLTSYTLVIGGLLLLSGCFSIRNYPHSRGVGDKSPYTRLNWNLPGILYPAFFFEEWPTERSLYYQGPFRFDRGRNPVTDFGVVSLYEDMYLDETEIPVGAYREFLFHVSRDSVDFQSLLPSLPADLDSLYLSNPPFLFHPVVGVSKAQAQAYCQWRTKVVNEYIGSEIAQGNGRYQNKEGQQLAVLFRLPTEAEWEYAASGGVDTARFPYGYSTLLGPVEFEDDDYNYLHDRYWFDRGKENLKIELEAFEATNPKLPVFNVQWPYMPDALKIPVPAYVYSFQPNNLGFFHLIGNVREWVADSPQSKGGSFFDPLTKISIQGGHDPDDQSPMLVGFRCACEVGYVDQP